MTAVAFGLIAVGGMTGWLAAVHYWIAACGTVLILVDLKARRLPNTITFAAFAGTSILLVGAAVNREQGSLSRAFAAAAVLGAAFLLMTAGGMGLGDVKLAPTLGALLGWHSWPNVLLGAFAMFALAGLINLAQRRVRGRVAFGPYMIVGALGVSLCTF